MTASPKPLRGAAVLVQRIKNRDAMIEALRAQIAGLQTIKNEHRWWVTVRGFHWYGLTHAEATTKLKECADAGFGEFAAIVEDP